MKCINIKEIKNNIIIFLKNYNYNLYINNIIILKINIPNTLLKMIYII